MVIEWLKTMLLMKTVQIVNSKIKQSLVLQNNLRVVTIAYRLIIQPEW